MPNFIKIYHMVQKLLVGDTQTDALVIPKASLSFLKESRLESEIKKL
jgi:hypothetical protein